jgi:predicted ATPase
MKKYVLTGGPGIGKTTVLNILTERGYKIIPEAARLIIEEEKNKDSEALPWKNLQLFQEKVAAEQIKLESKIIDEQVFLDRGLIDNHGYCTHKKVPTPKVALEEGRGRYNKVFILDRIPGYKTDESRFEDEKTAKEIHSAIIQSYLDFGYDIVTVPVLPPEERADFIINNI